MKTAAHLCVCIRVFPGFNAAASAHVWPVQPYFWAILFYKFTYPSEMTFVQSFHGRTAWLACLKAASMVKKYAAGIVSRNLPKTLQWNNWSGLSLLFTTLGKTSSRPWSGYHQCHPVCFLLKEEREKHSLPCSHSVLHIFNIFSSLLNMIICICWISLIAVILISAGATCFIFYVFH